MKADFSKLVRLTESHIEPATETLTRAFYDYPIYSYVFPDASEREKDLPLLHQGSVQYGLLNGEVWATPNMEGVAAWVSPANTNYPAPTPKVSKDALDRIEHFGRESYAVCKRHVPSAHWYLMVIGVDPIYQGKGYASRLLNPMLARAEQEHLPCYVNTEVEKNVAMYQHFGFRVVDDSILNGIGIRSWGMLRKNSD